MSRAFLLTTAGAFALIASAAHAADAAAAEEPGHKDLAEVVVTAAPYVVSLDSTTTSGPRPAFSAPEVIQPLSTVEYEPSARPSKAPSRRWVGMR